MFGDLAFLLGEGLFYADKKNVILVIFFLTIFVLFLS